MKTDDSPSHTIYISGPMRGCDNLNYPAFGQAEALLKGFFPRSVIISPAELCPQDMEATDALKRDYLALTACDWIAFLPGWQTSEGARTEYAIARSLDMLCLFIYDEMDNFWGPTTFEEADEDGYIPIEDIAWRKVHGKRGQAYGPPTRDFGRTAGLWSSVLGTTVTPVGVALGMIGVKSSRLTESPQHLDSWVDLVGYAICGHAVAQELDV